MTGLAHSETARIAVLLATYGEQSWSDMAREQALPSVLAAGFDDAIRVHLPDSSLAEARNRAAFEAKEYDWLLFLDADDQLGEGYYEIAQQACRGAAWLWPLLAPKMANITKPEKAIWPNRSRPIEELNHCVIGTLLPRELFMRAGGFREWPVYEDWELWLRCIRLGARVEYIDAVYLADLSEGRNTPSLKIRKQTYDLIRAEHFAELEARK